MKTLLLVAAVFTLAGCATSPVTPSASLLFRPRTVAAATVPDVDTQFYQTLAGCQAVLTGFEAQSNTLKWWGVGLQTAGGLLGSVFLPIAVAANAAKTTVVALGALAGFTNTEISVVRNEGLGVAAVLTTRAGVLSAMQVALSKYYAARSTTPLDLGKLQAANDELAVACLSYSLALPNAAPITSGP